MGTTSRLPFKSRPPGDGFETGTVMDTSSAVFHRILDLKRPGCLSRLYFYITPQAKACQNTLRFFPLVAGYALSPRRFCMLGRKPPYVSAAKTGDCPLRINAHSLNKDISTPLFREGRRPSRRNPLQVRVLVADEPLLVGPVCGSAGASMVRRK